MIKVLRIDDRLLHGQVAQSWTSFYHIDKIFIINDGVMNDEFTKLTLNLAKPKNVELLFYEMHECRGVLLDALECNDRMWKILQICGKFTRFYHRFTLLILVDYVIKWIITL